jgi:uncharacterized protein YcaQ
MAHLPVHEVTLETLSTRRLNRALLARQHLLARTERPMNDVIEEIGGLQTQYAPSGYIALWTRLERFAKRDLTEAMERREVLHGTLMRVTIHSVTARDYWPIVAGIRRSRQKWIRRVSKGQWPDLDFERVADDLREVLADGPMRARDVTRAMTERGHPPQAVGWSSLWVDLVRIPPSGTWERRANDLYEISERWLPPDSSPTPMPDEIDGVRLLVRRYLGGFGPARLADISDWAGIPVRLVRDALEGMQLRRFRDEQDRELIDAPNAPLPAEDTPAPVRFLPVWDPTLLVNCRRTQILPEELRPRVFNVRTPQSVNTFLVDGAVAGAWRHDAGRIVTESFVDLPTHVQREVDDEAERLALLYTA